MTDAPHLPRPSSLWKGLSPDRKILAADAFWKDDSAAAEQAEVIAAIAYRLKFRPKSVIALTREKKSRYLIGLGLVTEMAAARLLVAYHLEHQRPMMGHFLDALGVAHEGGLIADEDMAAPSEDRLKAGAKAIAAVYPAPDVALYLSTLVWQDPDTWGGLAPLPESQGAGESGS